MISKMIWLCVVLLWVTACQDVQRSKDQDISVFRVGYSIEPPYSYLDQQGKLTGYSVAMVNSILSALGTKNIQWTLLPFSELLPSLKEGSINMIGTHLFVSEQRRQLVRFAQPGAWVCSGLLINPDTYEESLAQTESPRYVVLQDSAEHRYLQNTSAAKPLTVVPDINLGVKALQQGHGDLLALSMPTVALLSRQSGNWQARYASPGETSKKLATPIAVAFRPADKALADRWNKVQMKVAASLRQELTSHYPYFLHVDTDALADAACLQAFRQQQAGERQQGGGHG